MIKVILFDVDGVIVDTGFFSEKLSKEQGTPSENILPFFKGKFQECQLGKADLKEELENVKDDWGWDRSVDELMEYWFVDSKNVNKDLINDISQYRKDGIKCFLGTNQEKYRAKYLMDEAGLSEVLDGAFVSADIGVRKPAKEFFEYVLKELPGVNKEEVLFWDSDDEIVDAAKDFGFNSELYTTYDDFKSKMRDYLAK